MISFSVSGEPIAQGSMNAFCPVSPNADIEASLDWLANAYGEEEPECMALINRLDAIKKWPVYQKHKPGAKTPGHFVASMHASNAGPLKKWRDKIAAAAKIAWANAGSHPIITWGVNVEVIYWFRRPKIHFGTGRNAGTLKQSAPEQSDHHHKPDRDKLDRAVNDAITQAGVVWDDDKCNAGGGSWKRWRDSREEEEGVEITIF